MDELPYSELVRVSCEVSERTHLEASFSYRVRESSKKSSPREYPKEYKIETLFLFPNQLNVNPQTYPISSFYRDMKSFINFRIPKLTYKEMIGVGKNQHNSPIYRIKTYLNSIKALDKDPQIKIKYLSHELQIWACALYFFLERKKSKFEKQISLSRVYGPTKTVRQGFIDLSNLHELLKTWHETRTLVRASSSQGSEIAETISEVEEYVFMLMRDYLAQTWINFSTLPNSEVLILRIKRFSRLLRWYAHRNKLYWLDEHSDSEAKENYLYRRAELKKLIWSSLYIDTRHQPFFKIRRQSGAMIAAALAGAWALATNIMLLRGMTQSTVGTGSIIIIVGLVFAYVLKDRIKEIGRSRFKSGLFGRLPDTSSKLLYDSGNFKVPVAIGRHTERASYKSKESIPIDLHQILPSQTLQNKSCIVYRRVLTVDSKKIARFHLKLRGIYDFFRINLAPLTFFIETSNEQLSIITRQLEISSEPIPKIYKIDMIIRITGRPHKGRKPLHHHYSVILSKDEILRVQKIPLPSDM
ncbi:MAG: hypothetical protein HRU19_17520 [Pseudobacteriovorax sp.]|nr:hypothetical protein [Pseudobacteriovorax sp.]